MITLEDKLKFCQLVEPDKDFTILDLDHCGQFIAWVITPDDYQAVLHNDLESLCMRWLIDNQDKDTNVKDEYDLFDKPSFNTYLDVREWLSTIVFSIDNIISLALEL